MHLLVSALAMGGSVPNMSLETGGVARGPVEDKCGLMIGCLAVQIGYFWNARTEVSTLLPEQVFLKPMSQCCLVICLPVTRPPWRTTRRMVNGQRQQIQFSQYWKIPAKHKRRASPKKHVCFSPPFLAQNHWSWRKIRVPTLAFQWGSAQGIALWAVLSVDS